MARVKMARIKMHGPLGLKVSSALALNSIAVSTYLRRIFGSRMEPTWDAYLEIGVRFWRHQFTRALNGGDIAKGRMILDSLQTETTDVYDVDVRETTGAGGRWYHPRQGTTDATILYFHGGGYAFHGAMSHRFAAMLAHHIGAPVFAPDYRLTPEHPHPAQSEDALAAWEYLTEEISPEKSVLIGDSAGAHMVLMLLHELKRIGRRQPAGAIALSPWTDIGDSVPHLHANDRYDLVQGWMAVKFGEWLNGGGRFVRDALSPVAHDYRDCAPIYLQAGGREIFHQTSIAFAEAQKNNGARLMLDIWPTMPHDFQLFDSSQTASTEALKRISEAVRFFVGEAASFTPNGRTVVENAFGKRPPCGVSAPVNNISGLLTADEKS
ncbi:alpha/beta hydrolase [Eilatimonas milleporae]|uniref:Acetyl esterase/lipase n=1 Tax=Eilatimonas milleporae TaxID=911205 RepID=A0A3M0CGK6_9PROT|nr:alpha/beta hydrolase fold domain-containing protein [Eilatimonas milleporae]RMB08741.1 acetyl esterase/lipase [Eilatimonas milleporae]